MPFKTELHLHTAESSTCANFAAAEVAERYISYGYTTVVVTNHYNSYNLDLAGDDWRSRIDHHLMGYRAMKEYAKDRLCVLPGCELRFEENDNDYLIIGADEKFLTEHENLHRMSLGSFSKLAHQNGLLIIQAHPFRNGMKVMNPEYLDGIEIFNGHAGHRSRNMIAKEWAKLHGLIPTSGTDFHHPSQYGCGGIITNDPIYTLETLISILKSREYSLICQGPTAERDGMSDMPAKY